MTARGALFALGALALAATGGTSPAAAQATTGGGPVFSDILVSSMREGRVVASGRTDARGDFHLDLPPGDHSICLDGASLRSALARAPGGEPQRAETLVELLVVIALADAGPVSGSGGGPQAIHGSTILVGTGAGARSLRVPVESSALRSGRGPCFPVRIDASATPDGAVARGQAVSTAPGTIINNGTITDFTAQGGVNADGGRESGRSRVAVGDVNADGRAERRADPRVPAAARSGPAAAAAPRTIPVTGSISLAVR